MNRRNQNNNKQRNGFNSNTGILATAKKSHIKKGRRQVVQTTQLPQIVYKNLLSSFKRNTIKIVQNISTVTSSNVLVFTNTGTGFNNISQILSASAPFTDQLGYYSLFRITGVKLDVNRLQSENISSVFANGLFPPVFLAFLPMYTSTTPSTNLPESSIAFEVDPLISTRQRVAYTFPPHLTIPLSTSNVAHMYGMWNALGNNYTTMPGEIAVVTPASTGSALSIAYLYQITISIDVEFACDYV